MSNIDLNSYREYSHFSAAKYDVSVCDMIKYYFFNYDGFDSYLTLFEIIDDYGVEDLPGLESVDELHIRQYLNNIINSIPPVILFQCFGQAFNDYFVTNSLEEVCHTIRKAKIYYDCEIVKDNLEEICYNAAIDYFRDNLDDDQDSVDEEWFYEVFDDYYDRLIIHLKETLDF